MSEMLVVYGKEIPISLHQQGKYQYWRASIYCGKKRPDEYQGKTKEELQKKLEKALPCNKPAVTEIAYKIAFVDWIYKWYEIKKEALSPSSKLSYLKVINTMKKYYQRFSVGGITHEEAQQMAYEQFKSGVGWHTIKKCNFIARQAMDLAIMHEYIRFNPFNGIKMPPRSRSERMPLSHWEFQEFLKAIVLSPRCNAFAVLAFAGLRIGECRGLCWDDVNFQECSIKICRQRQRGIDDQGRAHEFLQNKTKNGRDQTIYPPKEVFKFLEDERLRQNYYKKLNADRWCNDDNYVFTTPKGKFLDERAMRKELDAIGLQINRPDLTAHYLRHTAGTMMYELSNDLRATQDFLRHANIQTTFYYVHTSKERKQQAMQQYDRFIKANRTADAEELFEF